jgi:hypothetical protein
MSIRAWREKDSAIFLIDGYCYREICLLAEDLSSD